MDNFGDRIIHEDQADSAENLRHQKMLFGRIARRMWIKKLTYGAAYFVIFCLAFWAFRRSGTAESPIDALRWIMVSMHLLLWFFIAFARMLYRLTAHLVYDNSPEKEAQLWRRRDVFITVIAVMAFLGNTVFLASSFSMTNVLKVSQLAGYVFFTPVFWLFWYPFGIASLVGKLWLKNEEMKLQSEHPTQ